jgi:hypothetical protein
MDMMMRPSRRTLPADSYDPKQRLVGGIVLFLLMMLLYYLLKAVLGISTTGADYALSEALPDELNRPQLGQMILNTKHPTTTADDKQQPLAKITQFEFLGLNGQPVDSKTVQENAPLDDWDLYQGRWYVQAASFKEKNRADIFVEQLAGVRLKGKIIQSGSYYIVRLEPQNSREEVKQQLDILRSKLRVKGIIKER